MTKKITIAIDGPAAAGKSTVAKMVAQKLSYIYIDTGAMYRALTLKASHYNVSYEDEKKLSDLLEDTAIDLIQTEKGQKVELDGSDVTREIRSQIVTTNVSHVAKHGLIRNEMMIRQQQLAKEGAVVMDGRDIGTYVLPNAELKIFLIASVEERAKRRHEEDIRNGYPSNLIDLKKAIETRDLLDSKREIAPLIKADDAIEIDTTSLSIDNVCQLILDEVNEIIS